MADRRAAMLEIGKIAGTECRSTSGWPFAEALEGVSDGATVFISGFGGAGFPNKLIRALRDKGPKDLTLVVNSATHRYSLTHELIENDHVRKVICTAARGHDKEPSPFETRWMAGKIELEMVPQGTFTERIRAGGAGIPAFYTPVGFGTELTQGKEVRRFGERDYVLEPAITGDLALVRADTADRTGNLIFRYAQMNFGPVMATRRKARGRRGARDLGRSAAARARAASGHLCRPRGGRMSALNRLQITWRAAQDIEDGQVVNLGIGLPVHCSDYLRPELDVILQSENGVVGVGPLAAPDKADTDLVDAGSRRITLRPGASIVDSSWSFAMIRGGHIDVTILGAFEVAANGDLANWDMRVPNRGPLVGGAMDLGRLGARGARHHGARDAQRRAAPAGEMRAAAHRGALREPRLYRPRGGRCDAARVRGA